MFDAKVKFLLALGTMISLVPSFAIAADKEHPDWPCVQKKVEAIAVSQVWDGPAIDGVTGWDELEGVTALIQDISSRAVPIDEAKKKIEAFAKAQPEDKRDERLTVLFAGVFEKASNERKIMVKGIEKYNRRQKELAKLLEEKGKALAELEAKAMSDAAGAEELAKAQETYEWDTRIFKERNDNIPVACELPVLLDQRLFDLAREIRALMKS
jgi:hypothetical protein